MGWHVRYVRLVAAIIVNPKQRLLFAIERCTVILSRDVIEQYSAIVSITKAASTPVIDRHACTMLVILEHKWHIRPIAPQDVSEPCLCRRS